jgi:hypothetical protein
VATPTKKPEWSKRYGRSRSTTASQASVWGIWSDPNQWNRFNTGIRWCMLAGPLRSGATATMETSSGSQHTVTFADVEPPTRMLLSLEGPAWTTMAFFCEVQPAASGSTLSHSVAFSGALAFLVARLLGPQIARHFVPVLDGLAAAAEAVERRGGVADAG